MSKKALFFVYLFFFFMYFIGFGLMGNVNSNLRYPWESVLKPLNLSRYFYTIVITLMAHLLVFRKFYQRRPLWKLILAILALLIFYMVLRYTVQEIIFPATLGYGNYRPSTTIRFYIVDNIYFGSVIIFIGFVFYLLDEMFHQRRQQERLKEANKLAELNFLEAQTNPHFLFNTINNIYSLALADNKKTATALLKLSDMMRYVTYRKEKLAPLADEVSYIQSLLEIHQLRQDHSLQVKWDIPVTVMELRLPPLLLVPLVENALKHGDLSDPSYPLIIAASLSETSVSFQVQNKISTHVTQTGGVGLTNLQRRLELLHENKEYQLDVHSSGDQYSSTLKLPL